MEFCKLCTRDDWCINMFLSCPCSFYSFDLNYVAKKPERLLFNYSSMRSYYCRFGNVEEQSITTPKSWRIFLKLSLIYSQKRKISIVPLKGLNQRNWASFSLFLKSSCFDSGLWELPWPGWLNIFTSVSPSSGNCKLWKRLCLILGLFFSYFRYRGD